MKKLIALIGIIAIGYVLPAAAQEAGAGKGEGKCRGGEFGQREHKSPEQITARIAEQLKKLEEHKARAAEN